MRGGGIVFSKQTNNNNAMVLTGTALSWANITQFKFKSFTRYEIMTIYDCPWVYDLYECDTDSMTMSLMTEYDSV